MTTTVTQEAKNLAKLVYIWKTAYYEGDPIISDAEYDYYEAKLAELWPDCPELQVVGGVITEQFEQVTEGVPMLSLRKTYDPNELKTFISNKQIVVELKIDGSSLELRYDNGYLQQAVTRGRGGELGFDVTNNALYLYDVPHFIEGFTGAIRGEVVITFSDFEELNRKQEEAGQKKFAHVRNLAAGTMQTKEAKQVRERKLRFVAYQVVGQEERFPTEVEVLEFLKTCGFTLTKCTYYRQPVTFTKEIEAHLRQWQEKMKQADYPCDGIVVQYNDRQYRKTLGTGSTHPHGARAFKWEDETAETKLVDIEWNTGRTGKVAPRGHIEEVELSGAKITHVTLHNTGYIKRNDIKIGSIIKVIRSGEVIPKHLDTISSPEDASFSIPTHCPSCDSELILESSIDTTTKEETETHYCMNIDCPAQQFERILYYVKVAEVDHLGEGILESLWKQNYVKRITDLYLLPGRQLEAVTVNGKTLGRSRAQKIVHSIERASVLPLPTFLAALGIRGLGKTNAEKVCAVYDSLDKIKQLTVNDLLKVESFALTKATLVHKGLQHAIPLIDQLSAFVKIKTDDSALVLTSVLSGMRFVVTGSFSEENPRKEIEKMIKAAGGQLQTKPNKFTSYLVAGTGGGSKREAASKLNTPILDEEGFFNLIAERSISREGSEEEGDAK